MADSIYPGGRIKRIGSSPVLRLIAANAAATMLPKPFPASTSEQADMNTTPPIPPSGYADALRQTRRVFVRDLEVMARVGVYDHEKLGPQRIIVSVDLMVEDHYHGATDELLDVLDYGRIVAVIETIVRQRHVNLIETLAEQIAQNCLANKQVHAARIKIEKPDPFPDARSVGIEIERLKSAS